MGTKNLDDAYLEYYKYKNSDREYVLTVNGYEPLERNFIENVAFYSKDIVRCSKRCKIVRRYFSLLTSQGKVYTRTSGMKKLIQEDGLVKDLEKFTK